jgi:Asp-tRNA(Asn)/Glu-tRNA(Gln) amidotransferase A subunit family amidase
MEPCDLNALEITQLLHGKELSALEIVESCLARTAAVDGRPGALDSGEMTEEDKLKVHA